MMLTRGTTYLNRCRQCSSVNRQKLDQGDAGLLIRSMQVECLALSPSNGKRFQPVADSFLTGEDKRSSPTRLSAATHSVALHHLAVISLQNSHLGAALAARFARGCSLL